MRMIRRNYRNTSRHRTIDLAIGQDYDSIQDYLRYVAVAVDDDKQKNENNDDDTFHSSSTIHAPSIYMFYTDLQGLRGLHEPIDYGGGIQYANGLLSLTPNPAALQIGLWLNGTIGCHNILQGLLQSQIEKLFDYCIHQTTATKIYLRVGYEFDNPDFGYSNEPHTYAQTFRYLVHQCYKLHSYSTCRQKIDFVWHTWAASLVPPPPPPPKSSSDNSTTTAITFDDYYPGDDYVDWVGMSIFSQLYTNQTAPPNITPLGDHQTVQYACTFAHAHDKPVMIAESTPFGGMDQLHDPWQDWFVPVLQLIDTCPIQMWSYIYCNWNQIPMWNQTGFGDSRLEQNETVLQLWYQHVWNNPQFRQVRNHNCNEYDGDNCRSGSKTALTYQNTLPESLSASFEYGMDDNNKNNPPTFLFGSSSSWIIAVHVMLLLLVVSLWQSRRTSSTQRRGYEAI